jgi:nitrous oxidase accessory protein
MNKTVFTLAVLFSLSTLFLMGLAFTIRTVKADEPIYIRSTGNVEGTDKIQRDGDIYTLTDNIYDRIVIEKSNIVIDGNGHTVEGNGSGNGFELWSIINTTIRNVNIKEFEVGIYLGSASMNVISRNNITGNYYGMTMWSAFNNNIIENNISSNDYIGINVYGSSDHITISGNNMTDNIYIAIGFGDVSNSEIVGNSIKKSTYGIFLGSSNYSTMTGNNITENYCGIELQNSSYNSIFQNMFIDNTVSVLCTENSTNFWDNGFAGNYWSDYEEKYPTATELDNTGIWDTPYVTDSNNIDHYPIVPELPSFLILPLFMIATLLAAIIYGRKRVI